MTALVLWVCAHAIDAYCIKVEHGFAVTYRCYRRLSVVRSIFMSRFLCYVKLEDDLLLMDAEDILSLKPVLFLVFLCSRLRSEMYVH